MVALHSAVLDSITLSAPWTHCAVLHPVSFGTSERPVPPRQKVQNIGRPLCPCRVFSQRWGLGRGGLMVAWSACARHTRRGRGTLEQASGATHRLSSSGSCDGCGSHHLNVRACIQPYEGCVSLVVEREGGVSACRVSAAVTNTAEALAVIRDCALKRSAAAEDVVQVGAAIKSPELAQPWV
jgi:hypothetical protein